MYIEMIKFDDVRTVSYWLNKFNSQEDFAYINCIKQKQIF